MLAMEHIEKLLRREIGLDVATIGRSAVMVFVRNRMSENNISEISQYWKLLERSRTEVTALIEESVVPETWFFRDHIPFEFIAQQAHNILKTHGPKLNILSIPCSTGEEPYSIAMTLLEAGFRPDQFSITATDVSHAAIKSAKLGHYSKHSFRGLKDSSLIDKYFANDGARHTIKDIVKQQVNFEQMNLLDAPKDWHTQQHNVVFCRNLFIYFAAQQKTIAYDLLHNVMQPGGLLIMGHAECASVPETLFKHNGIKKTFAFERRAPGDYEKEQDLLKLKFKPKTNANIELSSSTFKKYKPGKVAAATKKALVLLSDKPDNETITPPLSNPHPREALKHAESLANKGDKDEAILICSQYLSSPEIGDEAWYLVGLIHDSCGDIIKSEECFRRALYLNPRHYETLIHLSLLLKNKGDETSSKQFMQRADRASKANKDSSKVNRS